MRSVNSSSCWINLSRRSRLRRASSSQTKTSVVIWASNLTPSQLIRVQAAQQDSEPLPARLSQAGLGMQIPSDLDLLVSRRASSIPQDYLGLIFQARLLV